MKMAVFLLGKEGLPLAQKIFETSHEVDLYFHKDLESSLPHQKFERVLEETKLRFSQYQNLVYIMPCGVVVRALAPLIQSKLTDPAVVVMDVLGRWAISLLSGHEGGANRLAEELSCLTSAEAIVTTTTEAAKDLVVGIGCRKETKAQVIKEALTLALKEKSLLLDQVRVMASIDIKKDEAGLLEVSQELNIPLRFFSAQELKQRQNFKTQSSFVEETVGVGAVSAPAALLAGSRTCLIVEKMIYQGVTVSIAQENSLLSV